MALIKWEILQKLKEMEGLEVFLIAPSVQWSEKLLVISFYIVPIAGKYEWIFFYDEMLKCQ